MENLLGSIQQLLQLVNVFLGCENFIFTGLTNGQVFGGLFLIGVLVGVFYDVME